MLRYELGTLGLLGNHSLLFTVCSAVDGGRSGVGLVLSGLLAIRLYNLVDNPRDTVDTPVVQADYR